MNPFTCIFHIQSIQSTNNSVYLCTWKKKTTINFLCNKHEKECWIWYDFSPTHFDIPGEYFIGPTLSYNYRMYSATVNILNTSQIFNRYHIGKYVDRLPLENWLIVRVLRPTHTRSINELLFMNHLCSRDLLPADSGIPV